MRKIMAGVSVITALVILMLVMLSVTAFAEDECFIVGDSDTHLNLTEAIGTVNDGGTICLLSDVSLTQQIAVSRSGISFTIDGDGHKIKAAEGITTRLFNIGAGSVTFTNVTLADGNSAMTNTANQVNNGGLIWFHSSGNTMTLGEGAILTNGTSGQGGAVWVMSGTLTLDGGIIENCHGADGGAIYLSGESTVDVKSGYIRNNSATSNGAGVFINSGVVNMSGATEIFNNLRGTAQNNIFILNQEKGRINLSGEFTGKAGVNVNGSAGNIAGAVIGTAEDGTLGADNITNDFYAGLIGKVKNGNIVWYKDGECYIGDDSDTTMSLTDAIGVVNDGEIIYLLKDIALSAQVQINRADISFTIDGDGHKIAAKEGVVTRLFRIVAGNVTFKEITLADGNSSTSNPANSIDRAPLIWMNCTGYTVTLGEGAVLTNGTAEMGGAIWIQNGKLTLDGGVIENCYAVNGGAVHISGGSILEMKSGYIRNNKARDNGGGVFLENGTIVLSGNAEIYNNLRGTAQNNIFYRYIENCKVKLSGSFTGKAGVNAMDASGNLSGAVIGTAEEGATGAENIIHDFDAKMTGIIRNGNVVWYKDGECYIGENVDAAMDINEAIGAVKDGETIHLLKDIALSAQMQINRADISFTIDGDGHKIAAKEGVVTRLLKIGKGNVTFTDITLTDGNSSTENSANEINRAPLIWMNCQGYTVTLGEDAVLTNGTAEMGGAIWVQNGKLTLDGGIIENCYALNGGAVHISGGSVLEMKSGYIRNNKARDNGSGVFLEKGTIVLSGNAEIYNNLRGTAQNNIFYRYTENCKVKLSGAFTGKAGINAFDASGNLSGAVIGTAEEGATGAENIIHDFDAKMTGIIRNGNVVWYKDGECYIGENSDAAMDINEAIGAVKDGETIHLLKDIALSAQIRINRAGISFTIDGDGHKIKAKEDTETRLVKISQGNVTLTDITLSGGNTETTTTTNEINSAGLIWLQAPGYTLTLGEGAVLSDGKSNQGGAMWIQLGTLVINGGKIENCYAVNGGAIYISGGSILEMRSGYIRNNTVKDNGGGVFANGATVLLSGASEVYGNLREEKPSNIFLRNSETSSVKLSGEFTGKAGVNTFEAEGNLAGAVIGTMGSKNSGASRISSDSNEKLHGYNDGGSIIWINGIIEISMDNDSGVYMENNEIASGVVRFITVFDRLENTEITGYGTYVMPESVFEKNQSKIFSSTENGLDIYFKSVKKDGTGFKELSEGEDFCVDYINIPKEKLDTKLIAVTFVKLSDTYIYLTAQPISVNDIKNADSGVVQILDKQ